MKEPKVSRTLIAVTPSIAEAWLNANETNRKLRPGVVERYAADMQSGRWTECLVPIAFYEDGTLANGQHRLWAICESGVTVQFEILRGLSKEAGLNIDTGLNRTLVDNARISGEYPNLTNEFVSAARAVNDGVHGSALQTGRKQGVRSHAQSLEICERFTESVGWAVTHGPRGKLLRNGVTLGAVARAYMLEKDRDRLAKFCKVLTTGFYDNADETAAVALRTLLMSSGSYTSTSNVWREAFLRTQHAIHAFMHHKPLKTIRSPEVEAYPLKPEMHVAALGGLKKLRRVKHRAVALEVRA